MPHYRGLHHRGLHCIPQSPLLRPQSPLGLPAVKAVHEVYCRMMNLPVTASAPASDQSAHSAVLLHAGAGAGGLSSAAARAPTAPVPAVQGALQRGPQYSRTGSFDQQYAQQYAQPPAAGMQQQQHQQWAAGQHAYASAPAARRPGSVRCICSSGVERGAMVQCTGRGCGVWQHADCLGLDTGDPKAAKGLRCERCR